MQGMNTGIHDATNLAWKLAGVLEGWLQESVLDTYDTERRTSAQHLIQLDRDIASLISGKIPIHFNAPPGADVNDYLQQVFSANAAFTVGLGISYDRNLLNRNVSKVHMPAAELIGHRAPDVALIAPGAAFPRRLYEFMSYSGRFWILIFAGALEEASSGKTLNTQSANSYREFKQAVDTQGAFTPVRVPAFSFLTIPLGQGALQSAEALGDQPMGVSAYDATGGAYSRYAVDPAQGAIIAVRPDGIVGSVAPLGTSGSEALKEYFAEIVHVSSSSLPPVSLDSIMTVGEISLQGHDERMSILMSSNFS